MTKTSWVEMCVSDFEQSILWFEKVLGFRVIAREANEYAEVAHGETFVQLAADTSAYWADVGLHLLAPGQRGSGVEIVLLVEDVDAVYQQAREAQADIVRELADSPWHMRQFWVRHPDGYLMRPAQHMVPVKTALFAPQIADAFRGNTANIAETLAQVKETADGLAQQKDLLGAVTIYETLINEIVEHSHLYYEEEEEEEEEYEEEPYYPEEEGLEAFVRACIAALGTCLANAQTDRVAREKSIAVLFEVYQRDLESYERPGFAEDASEQLIGHTTPLERNVLAEKIRPRLTKVAGSERSAYGQFLLDLQKETLSSEEYLQICREAGLMIPLIDRLLTLGRVEEAEREAHSVDESRLLQLADVFISHQQSVVAERLVRARLLEKPSISVLQWLQKYYRTTDHLTGELEITEKIFSTQPWLDHYQQLRSLALQLGRWETMQVALLAYLEQEGKILLLVQIAVDEGEIDKALSLLRSMAKRDRYGYTYTTGYPSSGFDIDLKVAKAAEETRPHEAIELYQQRVERLIAQRERKNYQEACLYLTKMRLLYEKHGENEVWMNYVTTLREQHRNLRALKEELTKAGL